MKIAYTSTGAFPAIGGVETSVRLLAHECLNDGNEAFILSIYNRDMLATPANISVFAKPQKSYKDGNLDIIMLDPNLAERILSVPTLVYYIPKLRRYFYHQLLWVSIKNYKWAFKGKLKRIFKGADIVHSHAPGHFSWAAYEAAKELKIPFVITPYIHPGQYGCGPTDIALYRNADAVIALLEPEKKFYTENGVNERKVFITGLAADIGEPKFTEELKRKHNLNGYRVVTFIGRKQTYKGILELRKAADKVWASFPKTKFLFVGPDYNECVIDDKDERIINIGGMGLEAKSSYVNLSDIICLPSSFESFGMAVVEAWALKKPVVVSDNESLKTLVQDGSTGLVIKAEAEYIGQAISKLLKSTELAAKFGENGFEKYSKNYTPEIVYRKNLEIYKKVLN